MEEGLERKSKRTKESIESSPMEECNTTFSLEALPDEHLISILSFLDAFTLLQVSRLSTKWNAVANDNSLWKGLCYSRLRIEVPKVKLTKEDSWKTTYQRLVFALIVDPRVDGLPSSFNNIYTTLKQAVEAAVSGDYIFLLPGVQMVTRMTEVKAKSIAIIGLGNKPEDTVIQTADKWDNEWTPLQFFTPFTTASQCCTQPSTITCPNCHVARYCGSEHQKADWPYHKAICEKQSKKNRYSGLDCLLKNISFDAHCASHAICIGHGSKVTVEDCCFTNKEDGATVVNIYGEETFPSFQNVRIFEAGKHGAFVGQDAKAIFTNCEITKTIQSGIHVISEGVLTLVGCKIHHCNQHGVFINNGGRVNISHTEVYKIKGEAFHEVEKKENTFSNNNVYDCEGSEVGGTSSTGDCAIM